MFENLSLMSLAAMYFFLYGMKPHNATTTLDKWAHLELAEPLTLSLPNVAKGKIRQKIPNFIL